MTMLYLASGSPRRRELLEQIGVPFSILPTSIDETPLPNEPAAAYVRRLACAKAQVGLASLAVPGTAVVLGRRTPAWCWAGGFSASRRDRAEALEPCWRPCPGKPMRCLTAVALANSRRCEVRVVSSQVSFRTLECGRDRDLLGQRRTAGQSQAVMPFRALARCLWRDLHGSFSAVVGLPLCETAALLADFGIPCWQRPSETVQ